MERDGPVPYLARVFVAPRSMRPPLTIVPPSPVDT